MPEPFRSRALKLCLVCDDEIVATAVRATCPVPNEVSVFSMRDTVDLEKGLTEQGKSIVDAAAASDALLLAWGMDWAPVFNTVCFHVRRMHRVPIIALCGGNPEDQVAALAAGADDAMTIPLYLPLVQMKALAYHRLVAAIQASNSCESDRPAVGSHLEDDPRTIRLGPLRLDRRARKFFVQNREIALTFREFRLLEFLMEHPDEACSRDQILDAVWGINFDTGTNMVGVYMYFLRKKLAAQGVADAIQTLRGFGYRLTVDSSSETVETGASERDG